MDKKYSKSLAEKIYGEKEQPFQLQSQGIGRQFCLDNAIDIKRNLYLTIRGVKVAVPRYYAKLLDLDLSSLAEANEKRENENTEKLRHLIVRNDYQKEVIKATSEEPGIYNGDLNNVLLTHAVERQRNQRLKNVETISERKKIRRKL